jgi:hypothetical protein
MASGNGQAPAYAPPPRGAPRAPHPTPSPPPGSAFSTTSVTSICPRRMVRRGGRAPPSESLSPPSQPARAPRRAPAAAAARTHAVGALATLLACPGLHCSPLRSAPAGPAPPPQNRKQPTSPSLMSNTRPRPSSAAAGASPNSGSRPSERCARKGCVGMGLGRGGAYPNLVCGVSLARRRRTHGAPARKGCAVILVRCRRHQPASAPPQAAPRRAPGAWVAAAGRLPIHRPRLQLPRRPPRSCAADRSDLEPEAAPYHVLGAHQGQELPLQLT